MGLFGLNRMTLFEIIIKGTGSLEKDLIKITFQVVEIIGYGIALHYFFLLT